ncbi:MULTISPECIES: alpha/beta hydrolase [unclassified Nocardioides]|uniref:alpha/beta hydrolase n=1 Tax=unclassified Nocardioides TaxID=2615069 RepID=UPI0006FE9874|nr:MULTISPECIES: alpha/beta fold hydrolase [unclassified Nocardioides]KRA32374.1 peptidase S15 [Nocardioides sp. Root614]KRA89026.1 peptidase S15 [Nocardioides sp. Root682]
MRRTTTFPSGRDTCTATHVTARDDGLVGPGGRPCVVMAHGFGGTVDTGLVGYAEGLAGAGLDVLAFDYRGFGHSGGATRQRVSYRRQRADYHAAIRAARDLPGVDPERIVLWGTSYSGGHVFPVAVRDGRIAAVVSMTPAVDGTAALLTLVRHAGVRPLARLVAHGLRDLGRALVGRPAHFVPIVAEPGDLGFITSPGSLAGYASAAGPTWRNAVTARSALEVALNRPIRFAARLRSPLLVQVGELDTVAPPTAAHRAASKAGQHASVRTYPVGHFDVYDGAGLAAALADQITFLHEHLSTTHPTPEKAIHA